MALPLGFLIAQLGMRAVPVMLRTGRIAMRYILDNPAAKEKITSGLARKILTRDAGKYVDDVAKLKQKSKANEVIEILDPKKLATSQKEALMNTTYRDMSKLLQSKSSYGTNTKIAGDIQKGFGQSFSKESSGRLFIAGDRTTVAAKEVLKKTADAPKALPKPTAAQIKAAEVSKVTPLEVAKSGVGTAQTTPGLTALQRGAFRTLERAKTGKKTIPLRVKDQKGKVTLTQAKEIVKKQQGIEKEIIGGKEVIAEGLRGVGSTPKPPWWQATIPPFLRTGKGVWNPYKGAYPPQVSALRVGGTGAGIGLLAYNFPRAGDILKAQKEKENILSPEDILKTEMDKWAAAFNPEAITEEVDISLPERIE